MGVLADPFLERRKSTHRAGAEDGYRWRKHLARPFGGFKPSDVDAGRIRAFIEAKLAEGLNPATVRILVALLSALYADLVERGIAQANPCRGLPRSTMRLMKPTYDLAHDALHREAGGRAAHLPRPPRAAERRLRHRRAGRPAHRRCVRPAVGARGPAGPPHPRAGVSAGPLKDKDSRVVPVLDPLLPVLQAWKLSAGDEERVIPPLRCDGAKVDKHTPGTYLRASLRRLGLQRVGLGWYEATRHSFASQWVLAGGSVEKLKEILGHYSVVITERYAHLRPDLFPASDLGTIALDLRPGGDVRPMAEGDRRATAAAKPGAIGHSLATRPAKRAATSRNYKRSAGAAL